MTVVCNLEKKTPALNKLNNMEPITLLTTALALATPYLIKTGEKIAENIGEGIWNLIKRPFAKSKEIDSDFDINNEKDRENLIQLLTKKINDDIDFRNELERAVKNGEKELNTYYQQNITNNGKIDKQVNIQNITGDINF
ncbi:MAG: hypothetical protein PHW82_00845 [Bacteroidales bacterium]|nr:hypothetical protein [Bacteroidales bacterium]